LSVFGLAPDIVELKVFEPSGREISVASLIGAIRSDRAVWIGESHDRYDNHLAELEIVRRLNEQEPGRWSVGVEFIQRRFQPVLDDYLAGRITEHDFLQKTEYFNRWGFDYRLYRPIFSYAKDNKIPMIALNAETELTEKVGKVGLSGLSDTDRNRLPKDIDKSDATYRERLNGIFQKHPDASKGNFEHFFEAQLTWDETMADSAAKYLNDHPEKAIVVLAGGEHIAYGSGIPNRMRRRIPGLTSAILSLGREPNPDHTAADYFLVSTKLDLPAAARMGVVMDEGPNGVIVKEVTPQGAAAQAGVKVNDRIIAIAGDSVQSMADARLALLDKTPGQHITLYVQRKHWPRKTNHSFDLILK
jgi:uncharacterized iron-regulated protein